MRPYRFSFDAFPWECAAEDNGWSLPEKAHWSLRLPIVRHLRFVWMAMHHDLWVSRQDRDFALFYDGRYHWVLYAVWRGWC